MYLWTLLQRGCILLDRYWNNDDLTVINADLTCSARTPPGSQAYVDCYFEAKDRFQQLQAGNPSYFLDD